MKIDTEKNISKIGFIYILKSSKTNKVYIGSTTRTIKKRFMEHKTSYKLYLQNKVPYKSCFELVKYDDCNISVVEEFEYKDTYELRKREGYFIINNNSVNKYEAGRDAIKYYRDNRNKFLVFKNIKMLCSRCGGKYTMSNKSHHEKTFKHVTKIHNLIIRDNL